MKLKILGMALLAVTATSALAAMNASALPSGHFYHHAAQEKAAITAHDGSDFIHRLHFSRLAAGSHTETTGESITCTTSEYTGEVATRTATTIEVFPVYKECFTTNQQTTNHKEVTVKPNGCSYTFHSQGTRKHGTVTIDCPTPGIEIIHPNCTIRVPGQTTASTLTEGISYTQVGDELTAHVTVNTITGHFESGICIFLGTSHKFEMKGSVTVKGFNYVDGKAKEHNLVHSGQIPITST